MRKLLAAGETNDGAVGDVKSVVSAPILLFVVVFAAKSVPVTRRAAEPAVSVPVRVRVYVYVFPTSVPNVIGCPPNVTVGLATSVSDVANTAVTISPNLDDVDTALFEESVVSVKTGGVVSAAPTVIVPVLVTVVAPSTHCTVNEFTPAGVAPVVVSVRVVVIGVVFPEKETVAGLKLDVTPAGKDQFIDIATFILPLPVLLTVMRYVALEPTPAFNEPT